jgi:hypothetical protein
MPRAGDPSARRSFPETVPAGSETGVPCVASNMVSSRPIMMFSSSSPRVPKYMDKLAWLIEQSLMPGLPNQKRKPLRISAGVLRLAV